MFTVKRAFRVQTREALPIKGVMIVMEDDDAQRCRVVIEFDNGAHRSYNYPQSADIFDELDGVFFELPSGEVHFYDLVKEIEVTAETKQIKVLSTSISALPRAEFHG